MKIIQVNASYKPAYVYGGPTYSVSKLCEALIPELSDQDDLEVITTTANGSNELSVNAGINVVDGVAVRYFHRQTRDHSHFSYPLLQYLHQTLKKCDRSGTVVHIHSWWNLVSVLSCLIAKWNKVPVVLSPRGMLTAYTFHNRNSTTKQILHSLVGKKLLKYCHFHATSEKEARDILSITNPKTLNTLYNLANFPKEPTPSETGSSGTFKLLFLSRIEEKKGLGILFDALSGLKINWHLNIAGDGDRSYIQSLQSRAEQAGISNRINWLGHVGNAEKFQVLASHDLLCLISHNENFANVVVESLSVGTPVCISEEVGLADYVASNKAGWITTLDPSNVTRKITEAYNLAELRDNIRLNGYSMVSRDFSAQTLAAQYLDLYKSVLANPM